MTRILITLLCLFTLQIPADLRAQTFIPLTDTVTINLGGANAGGGSTSISMPSPVTIKRKVVASDFPADWLKQDVFGLCDDGHCDVNLGDTFLWDKAKLKGSTLNFNYGGNAGMFELALNNMHGKTTGCFYASVQFTDMATGGTVDTITFIVCRNTLTSAMPVNTEEKFSLYPNPANSSLNIVYDAAAQISNVAVYNVIGKMMGVYKVSGNRANLNIENIPAGIYLVKLYNSNGNAVVTRKFTKQ